MRFSTYYPLGVLAAALLAGCSGDPAATTAPTTPSFSQTSQIDPTHRYRFSLSCSNAASLSGVLITLLTGSVGSATLFCGQSVQMQLFFDFSYRILVREDPSVAVKECIDVTHTTGDFRCKSKKWSATLTVTDLGPVLQ